METTSNMDIKEYDSFLALRQPGNGFLTVHAPNTETFTFMDLDLEFIRGICPLLSFSFEDGARGRKLHSMHASSIELISRFLRFLYTGHYQVLNEEGLERPCSLLMHAQLYYYGELYDVPLLMDSAYFQVSEICELSCSMPTPPAGLCETLRYLYQNVKGSHDIHDTMLHYIVNCFLYHQLGADDEFKRLLIETKAFEQDLFRINMERGFKDEGSPYIIRMQLPSSPRKAELSFDYLYDMFGSNNSTPAQTPLLSPTRPSPIPGFTVVHRSRNLGGVPGTEDSDGYSSEGSQSSDFDNFSLVGRPRQDVNWFEELRKQREASRSPTPSLTGSAGNSAVHPNTSIDGRLRFSNAFAEKQNDIDGSPTYVSQQQTSLTPLHGLGSSENETMTSQQKSNLFDDPSDADHSDSEWSIISEEPAPRQAARNAGLPIRNRSLYARPDLAGSDETIIALSDRDDFASEEPLESADCEGSDSDWSSLSDDGRSLAPS